MIVVDVGRHYHYQYHSSSLVVVRLRVILRNADYNTGTNSTCARTVGLNSTTTDFETQTKNSKRMIGDLAAPDNATNPNTSSTAR